MTRDSLSTSSNRARPRRHQWARPVSALAVVAALALPSAPAGAVAEAPAPVVPRAAAAAPVTNHASIVWGNQPQDFYWDQSTGALRHGWYAGGWHYEVLDGPGSAYHGATADNLGALGAFYDAAVIYRGEIHLWYVDEAVGTLRHAWFTGSTWMFETLDGPGATGGNGRTADSIDNGVTVTLFAGQPHVWYQDADENTLRHGWWTGAAWVFERLDGTGAVGGNGRTADPVGAYPAAMTYGALGGLPHVWYQDGNGSLRHGWWTGSGWAFETLDGVGSNGGNGRTQDFVGSSSTVVVFGGLPHVWYQDEDAHSLRHGWWTGSSWAFETLDGAGAPTGNGRLPTDNVGRYNTAILYGGLPHVWYQDTSFDTLRHGWWTGSAWAFETLDGMNATAGPGTVTGRVGSYASAALFQTAPHVWYDEVLESGTVVRRHAFWTGSGWQFESN